MKNFYKNKRVLITGHTGFKGSWLSKTLIDFGSEVCGYSLEPEESSDLFNNLRLSQSMISIIGDIRNFEELKKVVTEFKPEIVFHMAAQPLVRLSYDQPVNTYEINVMGTVNLLEAIRYCDSVKSVVNITTDKVYENKETTRGYIESDNLCGYDPYSNSKSCSELVTFSYKSSFFNKECSPSISTARAGNVIGAGDFSKDRIIPDCVRAGFEKRYIEIRNPISIRPYQYVLDCLKGYLLLAKMQYDNKNYSGSYNFGPSDKDCITTKELVDIFCNTWGEGLEYIVNSSDSVHESGLLILDSSKSRDKLCWVPNYNINLAVVNTVKLYKQLYKEDFLMQAERHIDDFFKIEG